MNKIMALILATLITEPTATESKIKGICPEIYPRTMYVDNVDTETNTTTLIDAEDFTWKIEGVEDWMVGDICSCIMYNNGTTNITDDKIVSTRYNGYIGKDLTAFVDRIENDYAIVKVDTQMVNIPIEDFNGTIEKGNKLSISTAVGSFEWLDGDDWYQFKSYDNTVWWALNIEDVGFTPDENKTYTLLYYDNGTTDCTECAREFECECEVYDDIFLTIREGGK